MNLDRRGFLLAAVGSVPLLQRPTRDTVSNRIRTGADTLVEPVGTVSSLGELDNDRRVIALERRLRCTCGCTLDVYTCRTTDFSCTYSPAMHRHLVDLIRAGQSDQQVLAEFVAKDGERVLMAPPAHGFNLAGYLLPGALIVTAILALTGWLMSRSQPVSPAPASLPSPPDVTESQRAELRRALDDVDA